jgi:hypothetical protein
LSFEGRCNWPPEAKLTEAADLASALRWATAAMLIGMLLLWVDRRLAQNRAHPGTDLR